jgi:hypothetical protein
VPSPASPAAGAIKRLKAGKETQRDCALLQCEPVDDFEACAMTAPSLLSLFPTPKDLLALMPEDLGGVIIEVVPPLIQNDMFHITRS